MKLAQVFLKTKLHSLGVSYLGELSKEETLVSKTFSSNGARRTYFLDEFHASFYCGNDFGPTFIKSPRSYVASLEYCEKHGGQLGEFWNEKFKILLICYNFVLSDTRIRRNQPNLWFFKALDGSEANKFHTFQVQGSMNHVLSYQARNQYSIPK